MIPAHNKGNRLRADGSPVWPLRPDDLPTRVGASAAEQRKALAILTRRVEAAGRVG